VRADVVNLAFLLAAMLCRAFAQAEGGAVLAERLAASAAGANGTAAAGNATGVLGGAEMYARLEWLRGLHQLGDELLAITSACFWARPLFKVCRRSLRKCGAHRTWCPISTG